MQVHLSPSRTAIVFGLKIYKKEKREARVPRVHIRFYSNIDTECIQFTDDSSANRDVLFTYRLLRITD